jgi:AraC family transcriptional regulator of adaptative response/methylated-DNA-[protein]-cysteine methyltransferase
MMNTAVAVPTTTDATRLQAVLSRDRAFDRAFVYGVTSTRIYCRPTCASRRPRADRLRFFDDARAAERAGFRACRRCRPDSDAAAPSNAQLDQIARACAFIRAHADERLTLHALSARAGMSPHHFQRTFTRVIGMSPRQFAEACRLRRLKADLKDGRNVTTALYDAGYGSSSRLYEKADAALGMTPATYKRGGAGATIHYGIGDSPFGRLLVAATDRGVAAVKIAASDAALERALRTEFHAATLVRDDRRITPTLDAVLQQIESPSAPDVPLDIAATAFQWRVWRALRAIPIGETRAYGDVARAIGHPSAIRAVARACAANPVALVIPCHRVVPAAGGTGGYRWGARVKTALLEKERRT